MARHSGAAKQPAADLPVMIEPDVKHAVAAGEIVGFEAVPDGSRCYRMVLLGGDGRAYRLENPSTFVTQNEVTLVARGMGLLQTARIGRA